MNASSFVLWFALASFLVTTSPASAQAAAGKTASAATVPNCGGKGWC